MRIISSPPFATSSLTWQEQPDQWTLTLVCKATFSLKPGMAEVAPGQDGINEQDNHWDDDPKKSVYAPSDLVPYKPNPEVLLVGSAYAPRKEPVRSLFARIIVGQLDKSVEVFGQRTVLPDGTITDGPRWTQMSLRYERAAGGADSWNPVGVDSSVIDSYGRRHLPNLQSPASSDAEQGAPIGAIGLGPLAARWPIRQEKLGTLAEAFADGTWIETPLGMDFNGAYFQSAPADQFVEEIRADETIVLENLHPDIERLVTRLPGIKPRTKVEIDGMPPWELTLVADTLWIDTNRATCTVTFRGQLPLDGRDQPGTVYVGVEFPGEPVHFPNPPEWAQTSTEEVLAEDDVDLTQTNANALEGSPGAVLPFVPSKSPSLPWDASAKPPVAPKPSPPKSDDEFGETNIFPVPVSRGQMPTWLGTGGQHEAAKPSVPNPSTLKTTSVMPNVAQTPPPNKFAPPPPVSQMLRTNEVTPPSLTTASHRAAGLESTSPTSISRSAPAIAPPISNPAPPMPAASGPMLAPPPPPRNLAPTLPGIVVPPPFAASMPASSSPSSGTTFGQAAVLAAAKAQGTMAPSAPSASSAGASPSRSGKPDPRMLATAAFLGAADASNAAASMLPEEKEDKLVLADKPGANVAVSSPGRVLVDLLWFEAGLPPRLEENPAWKRILEVEPPREEKNDVDDDGYLEPDLTRPQKKPAPPPPEKTAEQKAKEDKSRVSKVISRASSTVDVENALYSAINDDGVLEAPFCVVSGDLELPFDEVETLKVLASAAAPLATGDKKLKETIELANEALGTPLGQSPEVAANFSMRIREAWTKANRMLPQDYLDVHSRRVLLEQRKYQMRELVGAQWIRAVLHGVWGDKGIPTYLPADLAKKLPLFTKFAVRLVVEVLPQQDQNETHSIALRGHALARKITAAPRR